MYKVYFDSNNQKVRWTQTSTDNLHYDYQVEFDLLVEVLWEIFEDKDIPFEDFKKYFNDIRVFCDKIKVLME